MQPRRGRYESFGGILQLDDPVALAFVDQQLMRELGYPDSPLWRTPARFLSAPLEVHFNATRHCTLRCRHCTADAGDGPDLSTAAAKEALAVLAGAGVFHVAFGGGEFFLRPDALELAACARALGMVPNATTSGHGFCAALARGCTVFGQVNVSLDGIGDGYQAVRGAGSFEHADRAVRWLVAAGVHTGINCVLARPTFDGVEQVAAYAESAGVEELLLLRLKPSGRARAVYHELRLTPGQARGLYPLLRRLARRHRLRLQVDCSWIPQLCAHRPSRRAMRLLGVDGCGAGDLLLGVRADGQISGCSHHAGTAGDVRALPELWATHAHFSAFRERAVSHPICRACPYLDLCRGGCPLFAEFLVGDFAAPDPECPRIVAATAGRSR